MYIRQKKLLFADFFSAYGRKSSHDLGNRLVIFKPVPQVPQKNSSIWTFASISKKIVYPQAIFFKPNQPGSFQYLKMLGYRGLRNAQTGLKLAHTHGAVLEHLHDSHPVGVGKGLHHFNKFFHYLSCMQFLEYIVARTRCQGISFLLLIKAASQPCQINRLLPFH